MSTGVKRTNKHNYRLLSKKPVYLCTSKQSATLLAEGRIPIFYIRHGQTDWNKDMRLQGREDMEMNGEGISQANNCAEIILQCTTLGFHPDIIFSSPLKRAKSTAEILSEKLGFLPVEISEDIIERDYGELSGMTLQQRKTKFPNGERQAVGVEAVPDAGMRMKRSALSIYNKCKNGAIAVTHGGVINAMFWYLTGSRTGTGKNLTENCCVCIVAAGPSDVIPLAFNLKENDLLSYTKNLF